MMSIARRIWSHEVVTIIAAVSSAETTALINARVNGHTPGIGPTGLVSIELGIVREGANSCASIHSAGTNGHE
jgi:hypothetical protein